MTPVNASRETDALPMSDTANVSSVSTSLDQSDVSGVSNEDASDERKCCECFALLNADNCLQCFCEGNVSFGRCNEHLLGAATCPCCKTSVSELMRRKGLLPRVFQSRHSVPRRVELKTFIYPPTLPMDNATNATIETIATNGTNGTNATIETIETNEKRFKVTSIASVVPVVPVDKGKERMFPIGPSQQDLQCSQLSKKDCQQTLDVFDIPGTNAEMHWGPAMSRQQRKFCGDTESGDEENSAVGMEIDE